MLDNKSSLFHHDSRNPGSRSTLNQAGQKWPEEVDKIRGEMQRKTVAIETILKNGHSSLFEKKPRLRKYFLIALLVIAAVLLSQYKQVFHQFHSAGISLDPLSIGRDTVEELLQAETPSIAPESVPARVTEQASAPAPKIRETAPAAVVPAALADTVWFPAPAIPDEMARKKLRTRVILDPMHKGTSIRIVSRDSMWLFIRASKDSSKAYKNLKAYIDTTGQLILQ